MKRWVLSLVLATFSAVPAGLAFTDDASIHYAPAVQSVASKGWMRGYEDGSFQPGRLITRAEGISVLVKVRLFKQLAGQEKGKTCFEDVPETVWYAPFMCTAQEAGWIGGSTARPEDPVTLVEAAKLLSVAFDWNLQPSDPWYAAPLQALGERKALLTNLSFKGQALKREDFAELLWRIAEDKQDQPTLTVELLKDGTCQALNDEPIANVDMEQVRSTWLGWVNGARGAAGLYAYTYNPQLHRSANVWSQEAERRGNISHRRNSGDAYYDYKKVGAWFESLGLEFKNIGGITYTENIGWGPYSCSEEDCTEELEDALRSTFDFFMSEAGQAYRPHYNSVMNNGFKEMGLGIAVDERAKRYYVTVHYGTQIVSGPEGLCP